MAALVCFQASPKIEDIISEAPLITLGCSVKSFVEFTNPVNLIHDFIFDKSSPQAFFAWAIILSAHLTAALYPSSVLCSFPNYPLINSPL